MYLINSIFINLYPIYEKITQVFTENLTYIAGIMLGLITIGIIVNIIRNALGE